MRKVLQSIGATMAIVLLMATPAAASAGGTGPTGEKPKTIADFTDIYDF
jgi:hypothetical protein